jgi:hypothetical protein
MWATLLLICVTAEPSLPDVIRELNPSARFQMGWQERQERNFDQSGLELIGQAGVFPKFTDELSSGFQLSTNSGFTGPSPNAVELAGGMGNKDIAIHQVFLESHLGSQWKWSALFGKFNAPNLYSPLLWDDEIAPEGLFQSLEFLAGVDLHLALYAAQYSADQVSASLSNGTPLRRTWLFQQGIFSRFEYSSATDLRFGINSYHYYDASERLANLSGPRGNSFSGTIDSNAKFQNQYSPIELVVSATAKPLGIQTGVTGALAINFRTDDQQRGFFLEGYLGNKWKSKNFLFRLSCYYNEPDMTLALFTSHLFGYSNRKAVRGDISYFFLKHLRVGASFLYSETLQPNVFQALRKEVRSEVEFLF